MSSDNTRRRELLEAWEREFPINGAGPVRSEVISQDEGWDRARPVDPRPIGLGRTTLTRGEAARQRMRDARAWFDQTEVYGGDRAGALAELNAATDEVIELERTGRESQVVELDRDGTARQLYVAAPPTGWHGI